MKCPYCDSTSYKTLSQGIPRCCMKQHTQGLEKGTYKYKQKIAELKQTHSASIIRGQWVPRPPIEAVLAKYIEKMKAPVQWGDLFHPRPGSREYTSLFPAVKILLDRCNWDLELAFRAIDIFFDDLNRRRTKCVSFFWIVSSRNLPVLLAKANKSLAQDRERVEKQQASVDSTAQGKNMMDEIYAGLGEGVW